MVVAGLVVLTTACSSSSSHTNFSTSVPATRPPTTVVPPTTTTLPRLVSAAIVQSPSADIGYSTLNDVSCPSNDECLAVGYSAADSIMAPKRLLAERWDGRTWSILPVVAPGRHGSFFTGVDCPAVDACIAVGNSPDVNGPVPFAARWDGNGWTATPIPIPAGAGSALLNDVACGTRSDCVGVGASFQRPGANHGLPLVERWDGTQWTSTAVAVPPNARGGGALASVDCPASGDCHAVGRAYLSADDQNNSAGMLAEHLMDGAWRLERLADPHASNMGGYPALFGVSCASEQSCVAVGQTAQDPGNDLVVSESWDGTAWKLVPVPVPSPDTYYSSATGIDCASSLDCVLVGNSTSDKSGQQSIVARYSRGVWSPVEHSTAPTLFNPNDVSCASGGVCFAVGTAQIGERSLTTTLLIRQASVVP